MFFLLKNVRYCVVENAIFFVCADIDNAFSIRSSDAVGLNRIGLILSGPVTVLGHTSSAITGLDFLTLILRLQVPQASSTQTSSPTGLESRRPQIPRASSP